MAAGKLPGIRDGKESGTEKMLAESRCIWKRGDQKRIFKKVPDQYRTDSVFSGCIRCHERMRRFLCAAGRRQKIDDRSDRKMRMETGNMSQSDPFFCPSDALQRRSVSTVKKTTRRVMMRKREYQSMKNAVYSGVHIWEQNMEVRKWHGT